jgi:hypothetical protein
VRVSISLTHLESMAIAVAVTERQSRLRRVVPAFTILRTALPSRVDPPREP